MLCGIFIHALFSLCRNSMYNIISYLLFADADTEIYPHAATPYHARPKAKRGIAMLSVDKFPYPRKQTGVTNLSHAQRMFVKFWNVSTALKSQIPLLSGLNHCINTVLLDRIAAARKADGGRDRHCDAISDVFFSSYFTLMTLNWDTCINFTVVSQVAQLLWRHNNNRTITICFTYLSSVMLA